MSRAFPGFLSFLPGSSLCPPEPLFQPGSGLPIGGPHQQAGHPRGLGLAPAHTLSCGSGTAAPTPGSSWARDSGHTLHGWPCTPQDTAGGAWPRDTDHPQGCPLERVESCFCAEWALFHSQSTSLLYAAL